MNIIRRIGATLLVLTVANLPLSEVHSASFPARIAIAEEAQDVELPEVAEEAKSEEEQVRDGLAGLFSRYGVEIAEYNPAVLDVDAWERGLVEAHNYYVRYMPSIDEKECMDFTAAYFIANYSHTDPSIIPTLAERHYVSANNNVDLVTVQASDGFSGTVTQPADIEGFTNFQNFNSYNRTRCDAIQRPIHADWLALQEKGGGNLNPDDYADPSVLIQDEYERSILRQWYLAYVEGYDLTKGSFIAMKICKKYGML